MGCNDPPYDDAYLLRFLRARKFDLAKTLTMWNNFIKWRKENNVDEIDKFVFSEIDEVKQFYPHGYFKTDKEGRPIYIERIGNLQLQQLFKVTTQERLIKYYIQSYERLVHEILPACSKAAGRRVDQSFTILDLKGGSMKMMSGQVYDFVKLASNIGQDYYPEILGKMYIVNAPMLFSGIWAIIKPWIDEKTRNKIKILGSSFQKELLEHIDAENLPDFLGGKVPVEEYGEFLEKEQGPWVTSAPDNEAKEEESKQDSDDIKELKNVLAGLKLGGIGGHKPHQLHDQEDAPKGKKHYIPSDTPLNTQMDGDDDH